MKRLLSVSILAGGLLLLAPAIEAQDLAEPVAIRVRPHLRHRAPAALGPLGAARHLRLHRHRVAGPVAAQPGAARGYAPVTIIGAFKVNGNGDVTGWGVINAAGCP